MNLPLPSRKERAFAGEGQACPRKVTSFQPLWFNKASVKLNMMKNTVRDLRQHSVLHLLRLAAMKLRYSKLGKIMFGLPGPWSQWLKNYLPNQEMLEEFRQTKWPENKPKFSIVIPVYNTSSEWLKQAIQSVRAQTYANWELWCVDDCSTNSNVPLILKNAEKEDDRIHVLTQSTNKGISAGTNAALDKVSGSHVLFMDHDDYLEPHALHRFARAIIDTNADLLYGDEANTSEDLNYVHRISSRPVFSHDYYLNHPYIVHPICAKTSLIKAVGGLDVNMKISQDVDLFLRLSEKASSIAHIPDILYRWRLHHGSFGHSTNDFEVKKATMGALERHLDRLNIKGKVSPSVLHHNFFRIEYPLMPNSKVAILIPTKNRADLLENCLTSLRKTVPENLMDIIIIDHESDDPGTLKFLERESKRCKILPYSGEFNFSAIMNFGVKSLPKDKYTHYLFLHDDTMATQPGWIEHLASIAKRPDVGAVGATLLFSNNTIQHSGVVCGLVGTANHVYRHHHYGIMGSNGTLFSVRDYSAVSAACMMVSAAAFEAVNGFDESFAASLHDTDFCLRLREKGYKILQTPFAVLFHLESQCCETSVDPKDDRKFLERYKSILEIGDPFYSPYLEKDGFSYSPARNARCPKELVTRVQHSPVGLPQG